MRKYWLAVAFAAGIAVGVIVTRPDSGSVHVTVPKPASPAPVGSAGAADIRVAARPIAPKAPVTDRPPAAPAGNPAVEAAAPDTTVQADSGYSEAIDVGPVFREQFEQAQSHGLKDPLLEFHQTLEREVRNDAWAYAAEADIQNSLVADTSMGNFKVDHLECRATLCELRLSARGQEQSAALSKWHEGMRSQPLSTRLYPRASSSIGRDADADVLVIFTRPEKKAPEKLPKAG